MPDEPWDAERIELARIRYENLDASMAKFGTVNDEQRKHILAELMNAAKTVLPLLDEVERLRDLLGENDA